MRAATTLLALMLVGTAAAANLADPPTCTTPGLEPLCVRIILGDITVDGTTGPAHFNNDSYVIQGDIVVNSGGRVEIIGSRIQWADQDEPIVVNAGGTLVIEDATLNGVADGSPPVIRVNAGATLVVLDSTITSMTLHIATDDADVQWSGFNQGNPGVRLFQSNAKLAHVDFADNTVGLNVTGGAPDLSILTFLRDQMGIQLYMTQADLDDIVMTSVANGLISTQSAGTYNRMNMQDNSLPPDVGVDIVSPSGNINFYNNDISRFGIGMRCTGGGTASQEGNNIHDNLAGNAVC